MSTKLIRVRGIHVQSVDSFSIGGGRLVKWSSKKKARVPIVQEGITA